MLLFVIFGSASCNIILDFDGTCLLCYTVYVYEYALFCLVRCLIYVYSNACLISVGRSVIWIRVLTGTHLTRLASYVVQQYHKFRCQFPLDFPVLKGSDSQLQGRCKPLFNNQHFSTIFLFCVRKLLYLDYTEIQLHTFLLSLLTKMNILELRLIDFVLQAKKYLKQFTFFGILCHSLRILSQYFHQDNIYISLNKSQIIIKM
jgi:hypothetical protein